MPKKVGFAIDEDNEIDMEQKEFEHAKPIPTVNLYSCFIFKKIILKLHTDTAIHCKRSPIIRCQSCFRPRYKFD